MSDKVSIIVPAYNVKDYVEECIDSLIAQSYQNIEIIIVDDASTDGTREIIVEYARTDSRVTVIHKKKNSGVSSARNTGLERASGGYVLFVDADDIASAELVAELMSEIQNTGATVATCEFMQFKDQYRPIMKKTGAVQYMDSEGFLIEMLYGSKIDSGPHCKLFKREVIDGIKFNESIKIGEDLDFLCAVATNKDLQVAHIHQELYGYRTREGSAMLSKYSSKYGEYLTAVSLWEERLLQVYPKVAAAMKFRLFGVASYCIGKMGADRLLHKRDYDNCNAELKRCSRRVLFNPRTGLKNRLLALAYTASASFTSWVRCKMHGA